MSDRELDSLLEVLGRGDETADRAFRTFEPYLRMVVRRRLPPRFRARFDSIDVVQSVWTDLLDGFRENRWRFSDAHQLRGFLVRATCNRLIDRVRQHRNGLEREQGAMGPFEGDQVACTRPSASEVVQADDTWERLLSICPPGYRELLVLRREGLTTAEISARVGLHEGSVRRILGELARRLAAQGAADEEP